SHDSRPFSSSGSERDVVRSMLCAALVVAAAAVPAVPALAGGAPGLYLSWGDCPLGPTSLEDFSGPCVNGGHEELVLSFELAAPVDSVIELDAVVDVQSAAVTLPLWWQYSPTGCRYGRLTTDVDFSGYSACADF